jgi:hypothetical protein
VSRDEEFGVAAGRVMRLAEQICGSRQELARRLGVEARLLDQWLATESAPPRDVFDKALDLVLSHKLRR